VKGNLFLVDAEDPGALMVALQGAPGVADIAPFGSSLHLMLDPARGKLSDVESFLAAKGARWSHVAPIDPTLEDVFVQLVRQA
jgi:ABC-2 type transport system ATP-binding protein